MNIDIQRAALSVMMSAYIIYMSLASSYGGNSLSHIIVVYGQYPNRTLYMFYSSIMSTIVKYLNYTHACMLHDITRRPTLVSAHLGLCSDVSFRVTPVLCWTVDPQCMGGGAGSRRKSTIGSDIKMYMATQRMIVKSASLERFQLRMLYYRSGVLRRSDLIERCQSNYIR